MLQKDKSHFTIYPLYVLQDNIVWIWVLENQAVVVDPSISKPVREWLLSKDLNLQAILQTHHHDDHIGGSEDLLKEWPNAEIFANEADLTRIPFQTKSVTDKDKFCLMGYEVKVLEIPGHTSSHIAFFLNGEGKNKKAPVLFSGDTLFAGGCGRLFEGSPKDMYKSLQRINSLPVETKIYCGHEYTESNLRWANSIYPENRFIEERLLEIISKRKKGISSLPTNLFEERRTNLFIRAQSINELATLRKNKDCWSG